MRRFFIPVVIVLSVAILATACEEGAQAPTPLPTPTAAPAATPTAAPAATPTAAPAATPTAAPAATPTTEAVDLVSLGKSVSARNGCAACHSIDGSASIGPTWKGLYGKEETLVDGSKVKVDEAYLRESIVNPNAKIVKGFSADIMPRGFDESLSDEEIQAIVEYMASLE